MEALGTFDFVGNGFNFGLKHSKNVMRKANTDKDGNSWSEAMKLRIWRKGTDIPLKSNTEWKRDKCGSAMKYSEYGNRNSVYGWEIDHINPISNNGSDNLDNLQPLNWAHNASKSDKLNWTCPSN